MRTWWVTGGPGQRDWMIAARPGGGATSPGDATTGTSVLQGDGTNQSAYDLREIASHRLV